MFKFVSVIVLLIVAMCTLGWFAAGGWGVLVLAALTLVAFVMVSFLSIVYNDVGKDWHKVPYQLCFYALTAVGAVFGGSIVAGSVLMVDAGRPMSLVLLGGVLFGGIATPFIVMLSPMASESICHARDQLRHAYHDMTHKD